MSSALSTVRKINPIAFLLLAGLAVLIRLILSRGESLITKFTVFLLAGGILCVALFFEAHRVVTEEERKQETWQQLYE